MSIEEKKRPLEFQFTDKKLGEVFYEIKYETDGRLQPLSITYGSVTMRVPLSFFEEVSEFLRSKGILKSDKPLIRGDNISINNVPGNLPLPDVKKIEIDLEDSQPNDPISSFNVSEAPDIVLTGINVDPPSDFVTNKDISEEVIDRPVIRTRVQGDDEMSAENEAKKIRGTGKGAKKSTIKRKES